MLLSSRAPFSAPSSCCRPGRRPQRPSSRPLGLVVRASGSDGNGKTFEEGAAVKVVTEVKVFHAPGHADGIDLQGKKGVVVKNVANYKDKQLSPNLPYKVQFDMERDGKPAKLFAHLSDEEIELDS